MSIAVANATASFLALSNMLLFLGEVALGQALQSAVIECLVNGRRTADLGGTLRMDVSTAAVVERLAAAPGAKG